ncbi:hypothetical protein J3P88_13325 [Pseudomonas sp. Z3-6]|uniref:hypothetical protein n=1 Tax=Pseudomonas sp. Z3-6 TaxID=2817411 RepID=UPI003DA88AAA
MTHDSSLKPQANSIASAAEHGPSPAQTSALSIGQRSAVEVMVAKQPTLGQQGRLGAVRQGPRQAATGQFEVGMAGQARVFTPWDGSGIR